MQQQQRRYRGGVEPAMAALQSLVIEIALVVAATWPLDGGPGTQGAKVPRRLAVMPPGESQGSRHDDLPAIQVTQHIASFPFHFDVAATSFGERENATLFVDSKGCNIAPVLARAVFF